MAPSIEDYALVGDGETAALVSRHGSVDWLCWPRFDSDACFAALLGRPQHGRWLIAPDRSDVRIRRRYLPDTLILETEFETPDGTAALIDFMPPRGANSSLIRIAVGRSGKVSLRTELIIRFGYGKIVPWVSQHRDARTELTAVAGPDRLTLRSPVPVRGHGQTTVGELVVSAGERVPFVLAYSASHLSLPAEIDAEAALSATETYWRQWCDRGTYTGRWKDEVMRSLITLKALIYAPTGGIVAAPTTSLPERFGGVRNWDYRYCWLRDATFTLLALMDAGYFEEARAWRDWLVRAVAGNPAQAQIMYGVAGERRLSEWTADWLPGYAGSRPVRIGNAAFGQRQLDIFGEVADALHSARKGGLATSEEGWAVQCALIDHLEKIWHEPDEGIWEVRGPRRHFTYSKVMSWVALDRTIRSAGDYGLKAPLGHWRELRDTIHRDVCRHGFDPELGSFVQAYGSKQLDASLLLIPIVGFLPASDARVRGTLREIGRRLMVDGLVMRYDTERGRDGLPPGEGAFLACSFWYVDNLLMTGRAQEARELFEHLLTLRNDVGLLAEEYDSPAGRQAGNFPQAFSHVALVDSAFNLAAGGQEKPADQRSTGAVRKKSR